MLSLRRVLAFTIALLFIGLTSAWGQLPANELEGTWKMVSQELVYPDSVVDQSDDWGPSYKILNSTHFAWGRETRDGSEVLAGGGTYAYFPEEEVYVEHVQYHSDPGFAGQTLKFRARVEGDTWYHIGDLGDFKLREVWERVDPEEVRGPLAAPDTAVGPSDPDLNSEEQ